MTKTHLHHTFCNYLIFILITFSMAMNYELKSINVLFRHGDCIPDVQGMYPKDPYYKHDFYPIEPGGLTNEGKRQEYELGRFLRSRYDEILGKFYVGRNVYSRSTEFDRTKMSLLLVLASLYPPRDTQRWVARLDWQPIPIIYAPVDSDPILYSTKCPAYVAELARVKKSPQYKREVSKYRDFMIKLSDYTGLNVTSTGQISGLFNTLLAEVRQNFTLPEWTRPYFPNGLITEATLFDYKTANYNDLLKRLNGGMILRKIIDDMTDIKRNKNVPKIYLYSAHGLNLISLLSALNLWRSDMPDYSSAIILELWQNGSTYYVKITYKKGISSEYETLTIPGCAEFCQLENFTRILRTVLPIDYEKECRVS